MSRSYPDDRPRPTLPDPFYQRDPLSAMRGVALGLAISCAFWAVLLAAYVIGQR